MDMIIILVGLALLLVLTLKKVPVVYAAAISVIFIALFSRLPVVSPMTGDYMTGFANFVKSSWLMLLLGAILSKVMDITGAARAIASFIIECLYDDTQYQDVSHWIEYSDSFETAVKKWGKPQKKTLLHEYIKYQYLDSQDYILDKYFVVDEIRKMQNLLEHYEVDYSCVGKIDVASFSSDYYTEELGEYADRLQEFFVDNLLDVIVDDVFSILYMD